MLRCSGIVISVAGGFVPAVRLRLRDAPFEIASLAGEPSRRGGWNDAVSHLVLEDVDLLRLIEYRRQHPPARARVVAS